MRRLTVAPRINDYSLGLIETLVNGKLPTYFKDFMKENAGLNHLECIYFDKENTQWEVTQYSIFKDIYKLTEEFKLNKWGKRIPFAYDPGGWQFCISLEVSDYNAVYVNRWADHLPEEQFLKIAASSVAQWSAYYGNGY